MLEKWALWIKRRQTPVADFLYRIAKGIQHGNLPNAVLPFYRMLYHERTVRRAFLKRLATFFYYDPLFRSRCEAVGPRFQYVQVLGAFPYISGPIRMRFGSDVTMHSRSTYSASKIFDAPSFMVGDHTYLGPGLTIGVAKSITIGSRCYIASNVGIFDNDGHPLDPDRRTAHLPPDPQDVHPVEIGDLVWIGEGALILKGSTIGEAAVVAARSVVMGVVPPFAVVAGNPAKVVKMLRP